MKGSGENEVFVGGEFAQTRLKFTLVDQTTGLVDYDEGEDGPRRVVSGAFDMFNGDTGAHDGSGEVKVCGNVAERK